MVHQVEVIMVLTPHQLQQASIDRALTLNFLAKIGILGFFVLQDDSEVLFFLGKKGTALSSVCFAHVCTCTHV